MADSKEQIELPDDEEAVEEIHDELADRVMENFRLAKSYRSSHLIMGRSVDEWFRRLHNAFHKIHEMEELEDRPNMSSYFGLTAMKVSATTSYMRSKFINLANPPFNISPTPIVELPKYKQEEGLERVKAQLLNKMIENDLPPEALLGQDQMFLAEVAKFVETEAKNAKEALQKEEYEIAFDATQKMVKLIKDQLVEGNFAGSTGEVIFDIALKPVAVWSFENEAVVDHVWKKNKFVKETIIRHLKMPTSPLIVQMLKMVLSLLSLPSGRNLNLRALLGMSS